MFKNIEGKVSLKNQQTFQSYLIMILEVLKTSKILTNGYFLVGRLR